jgi:hypothetical protein
VRAGLEQILRLRTAGVLQQYLIKQH